MVAAISWWAVDGRCYCLVGFLVGSKWLLGGLWIVAAFLVGSGWLLVIPGGSGGLLVAPVDGGQGRMHHMAHQWRQMRWSKIFSALATCQISDDSELEEVGGWGVETGVGLTLLPTVFGF